MNKNFSFSIGFLLDILVYGLLTVVLAVLQTTLVPRFPIYDATPDIMIGAIAFLGIYRGERTAALFGLSAGLCIDGLSSVGVSFLPLFYCLAGFVCGSVGKAARENARFAAFLVTIPLFSLSKTLITFLSFIIRYKNALDYGRYMLYTFLPEFISTLALCIPIFLIVKLFDLPLKIARDGGGLY